MERILKKKKHLDISELKASMLPSDLYEVYCEESGKVNYDKVQIHNRVYLYLLNEA